ncbi:MAG TPA: SET domain-containing protein-lysine N-methyltransferase, partial [Vicinamibacterales bacterium]|nr:SET domain-containing protein-lysine N-methyltransferase [Vicinamibacterales bacterium]
FLDLISHVECLRYLGHVQGTFPRIVRGRSAVHGRGVFAAEPIRKNTRIIDYAGELIRNDEECESREERYLKDGINHSIIGTRMIPCQCRPGCLNKI